MGLEPGEYVARVDPEQLANLNMVSSPEVIPVKISASFDGDIIGGLDFTLSPVKEIVTDNEIKDFIADPVSVVTAPPDTFKFTPKEQTTGKISTIENMGKVLQIGAFKIKSNALVAQKKTRTCTDKPVVLFYEQGLYKVGITGLTGEKGVESLIGKLSQEGYPLAYFKELASKDRRKKEIDNQPYSAVIQVAAFAIKENAIRTRQNIIKAFNHPVTMIIENGFYNVQISGFAGRNEAIAFIPGLFDLGFHDAFVVRVKQP
jgi:hypothetical protein